MAPMQTPLLPQPQTANLGRVLYTSAAHRLLTDDTRPVLEDFLRVLLQRTENEHIHIGQIEVGGIDASEELDARIIVTLVVEQPAEEALALWRHLGDAIEQWAGTLPAVQAQIALEFLALDIEWSSHGGTV